MAEPLVPKARYRSRQSFVAASSIAEQYYCEVKLEQEYAHGEIPTEAKDLGSGVHEEVFAMEKVALADLVEHIEKAPRLTATFDLHGRVGELDVVGTPDAVVFEDGRPRWVIELKTTRGDTSRLWKEQETQVRVYGALLADMGFDCSGLELVVVRWRQAGLEEAQKEKALGRITEALFGRATATLEAKLGMKFFVFPHDLAAVAKEVMWAQGYWLGTREPIPSDNPNKCRACEYNNVCPSSLVKPSPDSR